MAVTDPQPGRAEADPQPGRDTDDCPVDLVRVDPAGPGFTRRRRGRGFSYHDASGAVITDHAEIARLKALVIPPAWQDVWISPDPLGHIQARGTDAAGRRQYRYHEEWRRARDVVKHDRVLALGERRATAVRDYLTSRGIGANRLRTVSYGEERPKHDNSREETRRLNRRAAMVVRIAR